MTNHEPDPRPDPRSAAETDAREGPPSPLRWEFGEREWQAAGAQQEITDADGEHVGWIECYQGNEANARLACAAPSFRAACRGPGAPGEPTPLDCLETVIRAAGSADTRLKRSEVETVERLARQLRAAIGRAEGKAP